MELSSCPAPLLIGDDSLQNWCVIGSGGFGQIHKARHVDWGLDVAIKLLHYDDGSSSSLLREADLMRQGGSSYVLRILGVYQGCPPCSGLSSHLGLVMEFMERGSLAALQERLSAPPPWPLSFRLVHQVALGMNFLHHLDPPLLHLDLKPSNVLLDDSLHAKLTDFGLARVYHSVSKANRKDTGEDGGTLTYMPPEAFDMTYKPTHASDIYSYGILLWSIITGEEPYPNAQSSLVRFRIPQGDRPSLATLDRDQVEGLVELVDLMKRCWDTKPTLRPSFLDCLAVTEMIYEKHKQGINDAVHEVQKKLDSESDQSITSTVAALHISQPSGIQKHKVEISDRVKTEPPRRQETAGGLTSKQKYKEYSSLQPPSQPVRRSNADPVHSSTNLKPKPVPNHDCKPTAFPSASNQSPAGHFQRQHSTPVTPSNYSTDGIYINMSNVTGLQLGDNNCMFIGSQHQSKRHRNPTAPSRVNFPAAQPRNPKAPEPW
ncbi:receptor-interacting serine/threonine-protein kinase 3 [Coregonus clupeaformis]|uniref:receptor-interacting serine/threonine-protein kinase 3 n=1 Tax=Coregonus clupeaformis TaxID=59861 RepID=UPI001BE0D766|nr:receptor-interacting serine/threonine-protein kinase 3 [Coregonus clupeaformis]XP_041724180.1 receptor-interacting serine/threonine-protein kinase 3 [Coregonus clupeaformis]XP_045067776.1 receptor-interacting serine/threonine-protein kinase 3 [Coregonus clupeaformis]